MTAPASPRTNSSPPKPASRPSPTPPASITPSSFAGPATSASATRSPPLPTTRATPPPGRPPSTPAPSLAAAITHTRFGSWPGRGSASCGGAGKITPRTTSLGIGRRNSSSPRDDASGVDTGCLLCRLCGSARAGLARPDRRHRPPVLVGREAAGEEGLHLFPERLEVDVEGARREHLAGASAGGRQRQETLERRLERAGELRGLHDAVHDAVALGRARRNGLAEQDQLLGARETDEARQTPERHGWDQALLHRREPEERLIRREAVVADERELEPTTQAVAVDPRDEELVHSLHRRHRVLPRDEVGHAELPVGERGEVHARRERTAGARQRDHADLGPLGERRNHGLEVVREAGVPRVEHLGALERQTGERARDLEPHRGE